MGHICEKCQCTIEPPPGRGCPACASHMAADELVTAARVLTQLHGDLDAPDADIDDYLNALDTAARILRRHAANHRHVAKLMGAKRRP